MTALLIEGGIYFLLIFTPFAFGGVESWALGILQIVTGIVVAAWLWRGYEARERGPRREKAVRFPFVTRVFWAAAGLFVGLVALQTIPLPQAWIRFLSPGAEALYDRALPGRAAGQEADASEIPAWVVSRMSERLPGPAPEDSDPLVSLPLGDTGFPTHVSSWRTLSVYPLITRWRLTVLGSLLGLFAVVVSYFRSKERLVRLLAVSVFSGFAVTLFGMLQKVNWNGKLFWVREGTYQDIYGPFVNRNGYAAFAGLVLPVAVCMALSALRHVEEGRRDAWPRLMLWSFGAIVIAGGIFHSLSRGGIISAAVSMLLLGLLVMVFGRRRSDMAVLAAMAVAACLFLVWIGPEKVIERIGSLREGQNITSLSLRLGAWQRATNLIADYPALGAGLGTFRYSFMPYAPPGETWWMGLDNESLELLCDTGVIGAALLLV
ncbi:MAG TPA: O-antigen ligase family protein, partial [Candidatus Polarisedimenticolia bacterium]|nr:O-antigen ligase family protein [Candidatus Polarisedimenticolia bacterium]